MSRAERRRAERETGKAAVKEPAYNLTQSQIDAMIETRIKELIPELTEKALLTMLCNGALVIDGHFGELNPLKDKQGRNRIQRWFDLIQFQIECFAEQYVTGEDMRKFLKEKYDVEVNIKTR